MGRPTIYSEELAEEICTSLMSGLSLRSICKREGMPNLDTVLVWAWDSKHPFSLHYARAREIQAETLADELVELADDASPETVNVQRLRVDTRKWVASKLKPKRYGDKLTVEGDPKAPLFPAIRDGLVNSLKNPKKRDALKVLGDGSSDA